VRTLFVTATALITTLGKALAEGKLDERLKLLTQPQLLICDDIGYLPIDRQGANLFFQLVSRRYERGSIIITSNQSLRALAITVSPKTSPQDVDRDRVMEQPVEAKASDLRRNSEPDYSSPNSKRRQPHDRYWRFTRSGEGRCPLALPQPSRNNREGGVSNDTGGNFT
jgi:hypothetical protein